MLERDIMRLIWVALSKNGVTLFRNNVALAWVGRLISRDARTGRVVLDASRPLHAGLCDGSSDLVGFKSVIITPEMVGRKIAVFVAVETKAKRGRVSGTQENFLSVVKTAGGIGIVANSEEQAIDGVAVWGGGA